MVLTLDPLKSQEKSEQKSNLVITWEALPTNFILEDEPVESTAQPLIAGALRESLELIGYIQPTMLITSNLGICATVNDNFAIEAPDWFYVNSVLPNASDRRSHTPNLEGEIPQIVMEFLSETDGKEYSAKPTFPPGKWYFYEQILAVPIYVIFDPEAGNLEVYNLVEAKYKLQPKTENNRYRIVDMGLFLGLWQGEKESRNGFWLRWWDQDENILLWSVERLQLESQRADREAHRAEQEHQRVERLAEQLRMLGVDPNL